MRLHLKFTRIKIIQNKYKQDRCYSQRIDLLTFRLRLDRTIDAARTNPRRKDDNYY